MKKLLVIFSAIACSYSFAVAPAVTSLPPSSITYSSANLNGGIGTNGGIVSFYFGTNDGGTNLVGWTTNYLVGGATNSTFNYVVWSLIQGSTNFYRAYGTNATGFSWGELKGFTNLISSSFSPTATVIQVATDTNGVLKNPANFFGTNGAATNYTLVESNVWGLTVLNGNYTLIVNTNLTGGLDTNSALYVAIITNYTYQTSGNTGYVSPDYVNRTVLINFADPASATGAVTKIAAGDLITINPTNGEGVVTISSVSNLSMYFNDANFLSSLTGAVTNVVGNSDIGIARTGDVVYIYFQGSTNYTAISHYHDDRYSHLNHLHSGVYSPTNHSHDSLYPTLATYRTFTNNVATVPNPLHMRAATNGVFGTNKVAYSDGTNIFWTDPYSLGTVTNWTSVPTNADWVFTKVDIGSAGMPSPELLNLQGTNSSRMNMSIIGGTVTSNQGKTSVSGANVGTGTLWADLTNAAIHDLQYATSSSLYPTTAIFRLNNLGFSLPVNSTVLGIQVKIIVDSTYGSLGFSRIWNNGFCSSTSSWTISGGVGTQVTNIYGSSNSIFGLGSLSATEVNHTDFSVDTWVGKIGSDAFTAGIDFTEVTVWYSDSTLAWSAGVDGNGDYTLKNETAGETIVKVSTNVVTLSRTLNMGGYSITNVSTNSIQFTDGTTLSAEDVRDMQSNTYSSASFVSVSNTAITASNLAYEVSGYTNRAATALQVANLVNLSNAVSIRISQANGVASNLTVFGAFSVTHTNFDTNTTACYLYQMTNDTWVAAANTNEGSCNQMLGLALGANAAANGMLLFGEVQVTNNTLITGTALFVGDVAGLWQQTVPIAAGSVLRSIGHATATNRIFFKPDNIWVTLP